MFALAPARSSEGSQIGFQQKIGPAYPLVIHSPAYHRRHRRLRQAPVVARGSCRIASVADYLLASLLVFSVLGTRFPLL